MTAWPRHSDGSDKRYAEFSQSEKSAISLKAALKRLWNTGRELISDECLTLAWKVLPKDSASALPLAKALLEYTKSNNERNRQRRAPIR